LSIKTDAGNTKATINHSLFTGRSFYQLSSALWSAAIDMHATVAIWRLPHTNDLNLLIDFTAQPQPGTLDIQSGKNGFAVSPFVNPKSDNSYFFRPHIHIIFQENKVIVHPTDEAPEAFWGLFKLYLLKPKKALQVHQAQPVKLGLSEDQIHFIKQVDSALKLINSKLLEKVVISRTLEQSLSKQLDLITLLCRLSDRHRDAFISLISIPDLGTWMGASPELLVEVNTAKFFRTVSLAGTQAYPMDAPLSEAVWTQKEIEEQAIVSRYIVAQFKSIRLREFQETGPRSIRAGSLIHLKSEYHVDLKALPYPRLGDIMLQLLHPTSAICGMPKQTAQDFIASHEDLERGLYGGFLGPVNIQGRSQLYVNLRCMQISPTQVVYYSGAGITHDSVAEKEWQETELKIKTLQDVVNARH